MSSEGDFMKIRDQKWDRYDLDTILDPEFDELGSDEEFLKESGIPRCVSCYFFSCRCASGLRNKTDGDEDCYE